MALDLNTNPYYDDFNEEKNFHRILFKPGYAVQARELTQLQTLLQEQVKRFGDNIFKQGAVIAGCDYALNLHVPYVKILDVGVNNASMAGYEGQTLVGENTGVTALIKKATTGTESSIHKTFHIQYNDQGSSGTAKTFIAGEVLHLQSNVNTKFTVAGSATSPIGTGSLFSLKNGIIYGKGTFVLHHEQTIVLDAFSSSPTKSIGVNIIEKIISSVDDVTLLDPANGSYNFAAPGADRLKLYTQLVAFNTSDALSEEFNTLFDVINGNVSRRYDLNPYGELNKTLANRTYDESGDYTTKDFDFNIRENFDNGLGNGGLSVTGNAGKLSLGISPGKAYVKGYEYETYSTIYLDIDKELSSRQLKSNVVSTVLGNYVLVKEVCGPLSLNAGTVVSLRSIAAGAITAGTYSARAPQGSEIGKARIQSIEYDSGTVGTHACTYRLYLYDIQMTTTGKAFSDVKGIYYDGTTDFHADIFGTTAILQDTSYTSLLFSLPKRYIKTLDIGTGYDNSFVYRKTMTATVSTGGTFTLSLSGAETWAFSSLSSVTRNNDILVIANAEMQVSSSPKYKAGQIIPLGATVGATNGAVTIADSQTLNFDITTDTLDITYGVTVIVSVRVTNTSPRKKNLKKNRKIRLQTSKSFTTSSTITSSSSVSFTITSLVDGDVAVGDIVYKTDTTKIGTVSSVTVGTSTIGISTAQASVSSGGTVVIAHPNFNVTSCVLNAPLSLGLYDVIKINSITTGSSSTAWGSLATNSTNAFVLNTGQTDTAYDIASISKKAKETFSFANKRLIVDVDYFEHSTPNTGYFSIDSYPLPVQGVAANASIPQIEWYELPQYTSPNGNKVNLRDVLDFRPTVTSVAVDTTIITSATVNPLAYTTISKTFLSGIYIPNAQEEFTTNVVYNIGRIDRIVIDSEGDFKDIEGIPDITPTAPLEPGNAMTLAFATIPPFPSISPKVARSIVRPEMSATTTSVDNRRYTMRDIGSLDKKLDDLKKFTEISFLEQKLLNTSLPNNAGQERPKTGVLVEDFIDHSNGNITDPSYNCTIFSGILQPSLTPTDVQFDVASLTNVVRASSDAIIVVEQITSDPSYHQFSVNETITTTTLTGTIKYVVSICSESGYSWLRLYLENVTGTGTFAIGDTVTGSHPSVGTIPNTTLSTHISYNTLPLILRPDAVVVPTAGNIASLPYTHVDCIHNQNASEAINAVNDLLFKYEGHVTLSPYCDVWFDESSQPEGNNFTLPTSGDTSWFSSIVPPAIAGTTASTPTTTGSSGSGTETSTPSYGGVTQSLGGGINGGTTGTKELDGGLTGPYDTQI
jgi:hypothetical protein